MENLADIGLIGLAVMGENLVLNMERNGYTVAVYNRTVEKVDNFVNGRGKDKNFIGAHSIEELVKSLKRPRKVMMLVKAGQAVDDFIEKIIPYLDTPYGRIGQVICFDMVYPHYIRQAALKKIDLLLAPSACGGAVAGTSPATMAVRSAVPTLGRGTRASASGEPR